MWSERERRRFDELRDEEARRALTETERAELCALHVELDAEEARALAPALQRMAQEADELRAETVRVETRTRELERIVADQERLLADARAYAKRLRLERAALTDEFRRLKAS